MPTTVNGWADPTTATEDVRPRELGQSSKIIAWGTSKGDQDVDGGWQNDQKKGMVGDLTKSTRLHLKNPFFQNGFFFAGQAPE